MPEHRFKILALDVDGTLLDPSGHLLPETLATIREVAASGIRPVLCTGRRYRRARPVAEELGLDAPLVCNSGALVKEPASHATLWRAELDGELLATILRFFEERDEPLVSFTDWHPDRPDFRVERDPIGRELFDDYLSHNREHASIEPDWPRTVFEGHYHLCAIGDRPRMLQLQSELLDLVGSSVQTFVQRSPRYLGTMCEVLRADASKWSALLHLAKDWDVDPSEICAVGDDQNDAPMLAGAGLGVAMSHAPESVKAVADVVLDEDAEDLSLAKFLRVNLL